MRRQARVHVPTSGELWSSARAYCPFSYTVHSPHVLTCRDGKYFAAFTLVQTLKTLWTSIKPSVGCSPYVTSELRPEVLPPLFQYSAGKFSTIYNAVKVAFGAGPKQPSIQSTLEYLTGEKWTLSSPPMSTRHCQCVVEEGRELELCDVCLEEDDDHDDDTVWFKCSQLGAFIGSREFLLIKGTAYISLKHLNSGDEMTVLQRFVMNHLKKFKPGLLEYLNATHFPDGNFKFISELMSGLRFVSTVSSPLNLDLVNAPACWFSIYKRPMTNGIRWRQARVIAGATIKQPLVKYAKDTMLLHQGPKAKERITEFERDITHASKTKKYDNTFCYYWGPAGDVHVCPYAKEGVDHMRECLKGRTPFPPGKKHTMRNIWAYTKPLIAYER